MTDADALAGAPPTWRPGYDDDTPVYLDVVRAMGIPGQDGPTGGDVVQGEVQPDPPVKHRADEISADGPWTGPPQTWLEYRMPQVHELALLEDKLLHGGEIEPDTELALEETPGQYEPHTMESDDDD